MSAAGLVAAGRPWSRNTYRQADARIVRVGPVSAAKPTSPSGAALHAVRSAAQRSRRMGRRSALGAQHTIQHHVTADGPTSDERPEPKRSNEWAPCPPSSARRTRGRHVHRRRWDDMPRRTVATSHRGWWRNPNPVATSVRICRRSNRCGVCRRWRCRHWRCRDWLVRIHIEPVLEVEIGHVSAQ